MITMSMILIDRKPFGSGVLRRVKKAGSDLMNKVPTKSVSYLNFDTIPLKILISVEQSTDNNR